MVIQGAPNDSARITSTTVAMTQDDLGLDRLQLYLFVHYPVMASKAPRGHASFARRSERVRAAAERRSHSCGHAAVAE